jgi:CheY-like chemotaxis protein
LGRFPLSTCRRFSIALRQVPIIAPTAHAMPGDRKKALTAGSDDFDTKPVNFRRMLGKIKKALTTESPNK